MHESFLIDSEKVITRYGNGSILLTSKRLRIDKLRNSNSGFKSLLLQKIGSCAIEYKSKPILIIIAVAFMLISPFFQDIIQTISVAYSVDYIGGIIFCLLIAGLLILTFFSTRSNLITIFLLDGSKLHIKIKGKNTSAAKEFVNKIEQAMINI